MLVTHSEAPARAPLKTPNYDRGDYVKAPGIEFWRVRFDGSNGPARLVIRRRSKIGNRVINRSH